MLRTKFIFFILTLFLNAKLVTATEKSIISELAHTKDNNNFIPLSEQELAFITSSSVDTVIITLMNEHLAQELGTGKKRITVLSELRELLAHQKLSKTSIAIIILSSIILATSSFFLLKWAFLNRSKESAELSPTSEDNEDKEPWKDSTLDGPRPLPNNSFFDLDLDLLDTAPSNHNRNHRTSIWQRGKK